MQHTRFLRDWQNIGRKLPLLTIALLALTVAVLSGMAYREMKRDLVVAAGERVVGVSQQIAGAFGTSSDVMQRDGSALSRDSALRIALTRPDSQSLAAAEARLTADVASPTVEAVELWNMRGERVLSVGPLAKRPASFDDVRGGPYPSPAGALIAAHDTVLTAVRLPILRGKDTVGYVRELSRVSSGPANRLLSGLIGGEAELRVGNASGDVWTDLATRVEAPSYSRTLGKMVRSTAADGSYWIGAVSAVPRSPWLVWVALPESFIVRGMRVFLFRLSLVALVVLALGAVGATRLSRHIIAPLTSVTDAAERIALGDYAVRVPVIRQDEVGRLAGAFNHMARAIQSATLDLENQQVELETQQLELQEANEELRKNVDEAMAARAAAEHSRAHAAAIIAGAIDVIITTDDNGRIAEFNPAAVEVFGYSAADAVGLPLAQLIPATANDRRGGGLAALLAPDKRGLRGVRNEFTALRADGEEFSVELAVTRIALPGSSMFTVFLRDLSDRKRLEEQLQQSQKMDAVGRLAGGVAHDFNNLLTVIISYTDLMLSDSDVAEAVRSDLTHVRSAADRATALTRQLLAFSRKQVLKPVVLDINGAVGDVSTMLARVVPENIRLEAKLGSGIDPIYVDRGQIEQVLMNLAVNARDAMPHGGSLTIETANVVLDEAYAALHSCRSPGRHVVLSVRDTGVGMDAKTRERIFEPFFTTKGVGQGTGLGLATVYGIVQQSGGSIYVYSEPGLGTTFKLYFPAHRGESYSAESAIAVPPLSVPPMKLLLVEDDAAVRHATRLVLEHLGHTVVAARDVTEALAVIRSESLDAVLTDAVMPGQSGLDLAELLATEQPNLPVIIMSGYTEEAVSGGRPIARDVVFVEKPFTTRQIASALASVGASAALAY